MSPRITRRVLLPVAAAVTAVILGGSTEAASAKRTSNWERVDATAGETR